MLGLTGSGHILNDHSRTYSLIAWGKDMKKQLIAALASGLISSAGFATEDQQIAQAQMLASNTLVPIALDKQAEMAAQMRLDDAMDRLNEELERDMNRDMEAKVDKTIAAAE